MSPDPDSSSPQDASPPAEAGEAPIVARCLHCNERTEHPRAEAGRKIDCPACGAPRRIPDLERARARAEAVSEGTKREELQRVERRFALGTLVFAASLLTLAIALQLLGEGQAGVLASARRVRLALGAVGGAFLGCGLGFGLTRQLLFAYLAALGLALIAFSPVLLIPVLALEQQAALSPGAIVALLALPLVALVPLHDVLTLARQRDE